MIRKYVLGKVTVFLSLFLSTFLILKIFSMVSRNPVAEGILPILFAAALPILFAIVRPVLFAVVLPVLLLILPNVMLCAAPTFIEDKMVTPILSPAFVDQKTAKIILDNGLNVYIVSDPHLSKAAAALSVGAGSWYDPPNHQGMAHFLEHMLFLGTKKYPQEASFNHFLKANGGKINAFTAETFTVYAFEIDQHAFPDALDRFSSFFQEPLLSISGVSREINAIANEFASKINNDGNRSHFTLKHLANPKHPYSQNNFGNRISLANTTTEDLRKWYELFYSSDTMDLVIQAPIDIETLKEIAIKMFSPISRRPKPALVFPERMTSSYLDGHVIFIEPLENRRSLTILWEMPASFARQIDAQPDNIISYVLSYEGPKSLLAELKAEDLATSLTSGSKSPSDSNLLFYTEINLTKKGINNFHTVVKRVFQAIENLKTKGIPPYIFNEIQRMETIKFQYPSRQETFNEVIHDAVALRNEPLATYPLKTKIVQKYDPDLLKEFLSYLTPKHAQIVVMAPTKETKIKPEKQETWMGVPYAVRAVPLKVIAAWSEAESNDAIDLPSPNTLIPKHLELYHPFLGVKSRVSTKKLLQETMGTLYFAPDEQYGVPLISWTITLVSPYVEMGNASSIVHTDLMIHLAKETLNPYGYLAKMAGLEYDIHRHPKGITISINGYNENAMQLLEEIILTLQEMKIPPETFERLKEQLHRDYKNFSKVNTMRRGMENLKRILYDAYVTEEIKSKTIHEVTEETLSRFLEGFSNKLYIEAFFYGNMKEEQALLVWKNLTESYRGLPYPRADQPVTYVALLPQEGGPYILDGRVSSPGNALILAIEQEHYSLWEQSIQEIAAQMLSVPCFNTLRTEHQTGYLVFVLPEELERQLVTLFGVESHTHDPQDLLSRTERIIEEFLEKLENDPEQAQIFECVRTAKIKKMETPPENLQEMGKRLYGLAFNYDEKFLRYEDRALAFRALSYNDFVKEAKKIYGRDNKRRLALFVHGKIAPEVEFKYTRAKSAVWLKDNSSFRDKFKISE
jgi:insulysin